jgi:predicted site-specific integrase-resolvase
VREKIDAMLVQLLAYVFSLNYGYYCVVFYSNTTTSSGFLTKDWCIIIARVDSARQKERIRNQLTGPCLWSAIQYFCNASP